MGESQKQLTSLPRTAPTPQVTRLRWDQAGLGAPLELLGGSLRPRPAPQAELPGSPLVSLHLGSRVFLAYLLSFKKQIQFDVQGHFLVISG